MGLLHIVDIWRGDGRGSESVLQGHGRGRDAGLKRGLMLLGIWVCERGFIP